MTDEIMNAVSEIVSEQVFGVWFLIAVSLVFFMQCGFAMVETGFTRAKNAGNIIMKNLMDFCIGTVVFILIGFGLLFGEDVAGLIGKPGFDILTSYENFDWSNFIFNLVFCATTSTIVSGAMAERTKFLSYCVYSAVISAFIYPIEAHWIWGGGWLSEWGFHDCSGSCAIHMVGGISAIIGAKILGPRIGKFKTDKNGKVIKVKAIPGHSLTLGALGCFILWFGWYGFNAAPAKSVGGVASIFVTTTVAPAVATLVCMIFTWIKYGKPDVSMCLNASLAGLVGITAGCDVMDVAGATVVGIVSGFIVPFGVWLLDYVLHIDDPVGAVAVHMMNGIWGTIAVGLFATDKAPENQLYDTQFVGLFYGGGIDLLIKQLVGVLSVGAWTAVTVTITFLAIKHTIGLRATAEEEILGLDVTEHNLPSSYADFMPSMDSIKQIDREAHKAGIDVPEPPIPVKASSSVSKASEKVAQVSDSVSKLTKISIICKQNKLEILQQRLMEVGVKGITVTQVLGYGTQKGHDVYYRGVKDETSTLRPKVKVEAVVAKVPVEDVIQAAKEALYTGNIGDGKMFIYDVENVVKVRTGEEGFDALQGEDY